MIAALEKLNVGSASSVVDAAFSKAADAFSVALFSKADDISKKSFDARQELASVVADANYSAPVINLEDHRKENNVSIIAGLDDFSDTEPSKANHTVVAATRSGKFDDIMKFS